MIQFDEHIFQKGWFNHQLDNCVHCILGRQLFLKNSFRIKADIQEIQESKDEQLLPPSKCLSLDTVDGRNPANQLIWRIDHYLHGFIYLRWLLGISSINSMKGES